MFSRKTPGRDSLEGSPSSCSSVVTIVAKFGKCFSGSSEKNDAPSAVTMSVSGQVSRIVRVIASGSGPVGRTSGVMAPAYVPHVKPPSRRPKRLLGA